MPVGYNKSTLLMFHLNEIDGADPNQIPLCALDELPIKRAVFIDSTWQQCKSIYKDERISKLRTVVLQHRLSQFWRHQKGSPRWFLSTVEGMPVRLWGIRQIFIACPISAAIHQFLLELHINAWGLNRSYLALKPLEVDTDFIRKSQIKSCDPAESGPTDPYNGQYDNLLFFFTYMYHLIHRHYDKNTAIAFRRPIHWRNFVVMRKIKFACEISLWHFLCGNTADWALHASTVWQSRPLVHFARSNSWRRFSAFNYTL